MPLARHNIEIVRRVFELISDRDLSAVADLHAPDAVLYAPPDWPEPAPWRGREAVMGQLRRILADFGEQRLTIDEIVENGDWVVTRLAWTVRGDPSGIEGDIRSSGAFRLRAGRIVELHYFWQHAEALKAVGLEE